MKAASLPGALLFSCLAASLVAQEGLPEARGKQTTLRYCTQCHTQDTFAGTRNNQSGWDQIMATMTDKGINWAGDADYAAVLNYLSTCLGPVLKTINVNKASACELANTLGIALPQANAVVAYREKNGAFKDLDGVKKVDGLDVAALDAKKADITF